MSEAERKARDDRTRGDIAAFLEPFAHRNDEVRRLLIIGVGGVLFRAYRRGESWIKLAESDRGFDGLAHIADWLMSSVMEQADWLQRVDADGRPLKLTKMSSIEQIAREADKAMVKTAQKTVRLELVEGDEELRMELADGFFLVRMLTPQALDRESGQMRHCVGHGAYDRYLSTDDIVFYSLRDRFNKPHATIQVNIEERYIIQLQGKQNTLPHPKYMSLLPAWLMEERIQVHSAQSLGFMEDSEGRVHHFSCLPDGITLVGNVTIGDLGIAAHETHEASRLPRDLTVNGDLTLKGSMSAVLPDDLTVNGDLYVRQAEIGYISPSIRVTGNIFFEGSTIEAFPDTFETVGGLNIENATVGRFPSRLVVGGDLSLRNSRHVDLPAGTVVMGSLELGGSAIERLPEDMSIGGSLHMGSTRKLEVLPRGLKVAGSVVSRLGGLREVSEGTRIGGGLALDDDGVLIHPDVEIAQGIRKRVVAPGRQAINVGKNVTLEDYRANQAALPAVAEQPQMRATR